MAPRCWKRLMKKLHIGRETNPDIPTQDGFKSTSQKDIGVKFNVASHAAEPYKFTHIAVAKPVDILRQQWEQEHSGGESRVVCKELLQSSFGNTSQPFISQRNGFVHTVLDAYNYHHRLVVRPDDLWIAILSQLNAYVNAHSEDLRALFVAHEGKKRLLITAEGTRYTVDFGSMTEQMGELLRNNIKDGRFCDFVIPTFSTTTHDDIIIGSAIMMSTLKAYFSYEFGICCGIPSVTLLGTKADYDNILSRISCLLPQAEGTKSDLPFFNLGKEVQAFAHFLRPIITQFSAAFNGLGDLPGQPDGIRAVQFDADALDFWSRICHQSSGGSGPSYIGGWLSTFCVWDAKGKWIGPNVDQTIKDAARFAEDQAKGVVTKSPKASSGSARGSLVYAGLLYPQVSMDDIPPGFCDVDVLLNDNGQKFNCMLVAGHIGMKLSSSPEVAGGFDTLAPSPQWFMFIK